MTIKVDEHGLTVQASRPALSQTLAVGAGNIASAAFSVGSPNTYNADGTPVSKNNTTHIRLVSTTGCWVVFATTPVAVAQAVNAIYLPPFTPEYFWVLPGEKVGVIQDAASGILNIAELVA
jgi:hypothetical protein